MAETPTTSSYSREDDLGTDIDATLSFIHRLNGGLAITATYSQLQEMMCRLLRETLIYFFDIGGFACVRGRKISESDVREGTKTGGAFATSSSLSYPPVDLTTTFGRCHWPSQPVFYASRIQQTVFSELDVNVDDYVLSGQWVMPNTSSVRTCFLGIVDQYRKTKIAPIPTKTQKEHRMVTARLKEELDRRYATDQGLISLLVDAFFADIFSRTASTFNDYKLTSIVSAYLFDNCRFNVIAYPSVKHYGSINYAIRPKFLDANFELKQARIVKIVKILGYGLYNAQTVADVVIPVGATEIVWPTDDILAYLEGRRPVDSAT